MTFQKRNDMSSKAAPVFYTPVPDVLKHLEAHPGVAFLQVSWTGACSLLTTLLHIENCFETVCVEDVR